MGSEYGGGRSDVIRDGATDGESKSRQDVSVGNYPWVKWTLIGVLVAAAFHMTVVLFLYPTEVYWLSYYVINYEFGFVRRGLGGEIIRWLPDAHYFTAAYTMMWAPVVVWFITLALLLRQILTRGASSSRRVMLAFLVPVLPFAFSYAVYSPRPELYAMSALVLFAMALTRADSPRRVITASAAYGAVIAVLTFAHEGIPFVLALGAVAAIVVLPPPLPPRAQRLSLALAAGPGLLATVLIALVARKNVSAQLCERVPHRDVENPYAASSNLNDYVAYLTGRLESKTDFHDWSCQFTTWMPEGTISDGLHAVATFGAGPLFASSVVGLLYFAVSVWAIQRFSGVPFRDFLGALKGNLLVIGLAAGLIVPVFMTGVDWTRWWVLITFNVAVVYVLFVVNRRELDDPPSRRTLRLFFLVIAILAILPTGAALHVGGPNF